MKKQLSAIIAALSLCVGSSYGAVAVGITNFTGSPASGNGLAIVNANGSGVNTSFAVGSFLTTVPDFASADAASIFSLFTQNGSSATFTAPGIINKTIGDAATSTDGSDQFTGNPYYILIGNAATLAASTEFIIFQGPAWAQEIEGVGGATNTTLSAGNLVRGELTTNVSLSSPFNNFTNGVTFVPEPSAALLGLLGAVGLIRRRR